MVGLRVRRSGGSLPIRPHHVGVDDLSRSIGVPVWASIVGWGSALGFFAVYFFVVHVSLRGLVPSFGIDVSAIATALFGTIVMAGFVIWLVSLAELPEMWFVHRRPRRFQKDGRCGRCGHPLGPSVGDTCTECGFRESDLPGPYTFGWRAVRRFAVALFLGIAAGVFAGEFWIADDEAEMRKTAEAYGPVATGGTPAGLTFTRAWPATFSKVEWTPSDGFVPQEIFAQERIRPPRPANP